MSDTPVPGAAPSEANQPVAQHKATTANPAQAPAWETEKSFQNATATGNLESDDEEDEEDEISEAVKECTNVFAILKEAFKEIAQINFQQRDAKLFHTQTELKNKIEKVTPSLNSDFEELCRDTNKYMEQQTAAILNLCTTAAQLSLNTTELVISFSNENCLLRRNMNEMREQLDALKDGQDKQAGNDSSDEST